MGCRPVQRPHRVATVTLCVCPMATRLWVCRLCDNDNTGNALMLRHSVLVCCAAGCKSLQHQPTPALGDLPGPALLPLLAAHLLVRGC